MKEKSKKWIDAANELTENPTAKIKCPECDIGFLDVKIENFKDKKDVYMVCQFCKKWNVVTSSFPAKYTLDTLRR